MASRSNVSYAERAASSDNPLVKSLFAIAEAKQSNVVLSADLTTSKELIAIADKLGPYIAVLKTHIDIVSDFDANTVKDLRHMSEKHRFMIFEDRKFIDIGTTAQKQYHGGALRISEFAHIVNMSVLAGEGIVEALEQSGTTDEVRKFGLRGGLILAEMTTKGSLATDVYTRKSVEFARKHTDFIFGFVATCALTDIAGTVAERQDEDFVIFTTGVNRSTKGDPLGQQYNTPRRAVLGGADFIIAGRGIYAAEDPVGTVQLYQREGWEAYAERLGR